MNRDIKFRGKKIDTDEWTTGSLVEANCGHVGIAVLTRYSNKKIDCIIGEVDPKTVGQFTGKADKNGKGIYDKDIVRVTTSEMIFNIVVKWSDVAMAFMACYTDGNQSPFSWFSNLHIYKLEVVGNIFDTPELLK